MELYQLRYFLAAVDTGSFTKAAARVHVSQPTLSAGIKKLEESLAVQLFDRQARRCDLSQAGGRFLDRARTIVAECNRARAELDQTGGERALRIGCLPSVPGAKLSRLVADYAKAYADIDVEITEDTDARLNDRLNQNRIDVAITALDRTDADGNRTTLPLYRERMVLAMNTGHPLTTRQMIRIEDLDGLDYVLRSHCPHVRAMSRQFTALGVRPRICARTGQDDRALALVASGLGVSIVPDTFSRAGVTQEPIVDLDIQTTIALVWKTDGGNDALDLFRSFAASHDWKSRPVGGGVEERLAWAH